MYRDEQKNRRTEEQKNRRTEEQKEESYSDWPIKLCNRRRESFI
jgi:hypothetical protein